MDKELAAKQEMATVNGDPQGEFAHMIEGIVNYRAELEDLLGEIQDLS